MNKDAPKLSLVIVAYEMPRAIVLTLQSLSPPIQRGIDPSDYELIVVDNGSSQPIDRAACERFGSQIRWIAMDEPSPSPAAAANRGIAGARAPLVGAMIDGARMASPGLLRNALLASHVCPRPAIATLAYHLGDRPQQEAVADGYDEATEEALLARANWTSDGYRLFDVAVLAPSSARGWSELPLESNLSHSSTVDRSSSDPYGRGPANGAAHDPVDAFGGEPVDLAFIDGMHLIEFALRDFINVERHSHPGGLVVLDDVFPPSPAEAARKRRTQVWTGDVFKIVDVLGRERADLGLLTVDTEPTGLMLVFRLDPGSERLADRYGAITSACVAPDPQRVPEDMLARLGAASPEEALSAPLWAELRGLRPASPSRCSAASGGAGGPAPRSADASRRGKPCPRP